MTASRNNLQFAFVSTMSGVAWGGSEELWTATAHRLLTMGCSVSASVYRWSELPPKIADLMTRGAAVSFRSKTRGPWAKLVNKGLRRFAPDQIERLHRQWLNKVRPNLVVISQGGPWDGVPWMLSCAKLGVPYCCIVHANSELWWPPDSRLEDFRRAYLGAKAVYFVSRANQKLMERQLGLLLPESAIVSNPCKIERSRASRAPWPREDGIAQLACVGRMAPAAKGQDILLEVLSQDKWRKRPLHVNFYGNGPAEQSLRAMAAMLRITNATFCGHVDNVRDIWIRNQLLVLPSRYEGLPLAIGEAMLCGRAVIATDVAGNSELVEHGVNGFLADGPSPELLDRAMEEAWGNRFHWEEMGVRAFQTALASMPTDPAGEFANRLLDLVSPGSRGGRGRSPIEIEDAEAVEERLLGIAPPVPSTL